MTNAIVAVENPVLWLSGTGTNVVSPSWAPIAYPITGGIRLSPPASISLGGPVLPPEANDFQLGDTASGNAASDNDESGTKSAGTLGIPGVARPTTSARGRSASRPSNSASGSRGDSGWGTAPNFQQATTACTHSTEFGNAMLT